MPTHGPVGFTILAKTQPTNVEPAYQKLQQLSRSPPDGVTIHSVQKVFGARDIVVWGTAENMEALANFQTRQIQHWNEIDTTETMLSTEYTPVKGPK